MKNLQIILDALAEITISVYPGSSADTPKALEFLSAAGPLRSDTIYLLTDQELPALARRAPLPPAVFCVACDNDPPPEDPAGLSKEASFVFVRGGLMQAYTITNRCMDLLRHRRRIDDIMLMGVKAQYTPEQLLPTVSQLLGVGVYVLNSFFQRISGASDAFNGNPYAEEIERSGALSSDSVRRIRSGKNGTPALLYEGVSGKWARLNLLLLWREDEKLDAPYLAGQINAFIEDYRSRNNPQEIPAQLVDPRLHRILAGKTADETECVSYFGVGSTPLWFTVLVMGSDPGVRWSAEAYQRQASLLRAAFRDISITVIHAQLCAVVRMPAQRPEETVYSDAFFEERAFAEGWDRTRLEQALQQCGVYLCYSSAFMSLHFFPAELTLCTDALDLAIRLDGCRGQRLVKYQDYSSFVSVKYAVDRFVQMHGPRSVRAAMYPELVTLLLHDIENHTDLVEVLYRYYTYGDVNRTAQSLFVHRNTVYNKLRTIQKILNVDLDDFNVRRSYLVSLQTYYYCEKILGLDLHTLE